MAPAHADAHSPPTPPFTAAVTNASAFESGVDAAATVAIVVALNADATLKSLGVTATATGTRVTLKGVTKHNAKVVDGVIKRLAPSSKSAAGVDGSAYTRR